MTISIVIAAYNNPLELMKLLDSIWRESAFDPGLEVIVVDDGSKDGSVEDAARRFNFVKYIKNDQNMGPASARNKGAAAARNDILVFLDSDVVLKKDTLSRIINRFQEDSTMEALCGEYDIEPVNRSFSAKFKSILSRSWMPQGDAITVFVARIGAIKRSLFSSLGGFDTAIKTASSEEWEFGRRLTAKGIKINYDPAIIVKHHFPGFIRQIRLFFHRSFMWVYVFKKYGKFDNTCTTPVQAAAQVFGFLSVAFSLLVPARAAFGPAVLFFLGLYITLNKRFFSLAAREGGWSFAAASLPPALILSCSIVMGGVWGLIYYFLLDGPKDFK